MATKAFKVDGNYPAYIDAGDMEDDVTGDWIRVPANANGITFLYQATDVASPVGTVAVDAHFGEDPTDGGHIAVDLEGDTTLDGVGAKKDFIRVSFAEAESIGRPRFIRFKYTRSSGGTGDAMSTDATVGVD